MRCEDIYTARFNPVFRPTHSSLCRYVVMKGSAGSGKSVDTAQFYLLKMLQNPGVNLMAVRKIYSSHKNSTFAELRSAIGRLGLSGFFEAISSPLEIRCCNGNRVIFAGCCDSRQLEKLKSVTVPGGKLTDVWIEEATELTREDFQIIDDRLRGELPDGLFYQIRLTFNPVSSSHWIKSEFFDRQDDNVLTNHSTYRDNFFCDAAYHARMERRRLLDPDGYRIYGLGEWGESGGLILPNIRICGFDTSAERFDAVSIGQDFGFNNANAILQLGIRDGDIYVRSEIYENERDTGELIDIAHAVGLPQKVTMYCDAAEPDRIHEWQKAGFRAVAAYKCAGSVKAEIDWLKQRTVFIHTDCVKTIEEITQWRWSRDSAGRYTDMPVPINDHAMAALRYGTEPWRRGSLPRQRPRESPCAPHCRRASPPKSEKGIRIKPI